MPVVLNNTETLEYLFACTSNFDAEDRQAKPLKAFYWLIKEPNGSAVTRELSFRWIKSEP